jgi:hypothetical protein
VVAVIPPVPDADDQFFWDGVVEGRLLLQACAACGRLRHPPVPRCGDCGSLERTTREASGRGTVHAWILSHHPTEPDAAPRIVVLVDLDEGVRLVSNLVDAGADEVANGMAVEVCYRTCDGVVLPQFRPVSS